ncbi:MAG: hypothetical protein AAB473_02650 [Patescibacteria group bacterium]
MPFNESEAISAVACGERMTLATLENLFCDDGRIHGSVEWIASE